MAPRKDRLLLALLKALPKNLLSRGTGWLADRERPRWLVARAKRVFVKRFGLDMSEAEHPIAHYKSVGALFARALAPGKRPVEESPSVLVSPVDACVGAFGTIEHGQLIQAKGQHYTAADFLGDADLATAFEGGQFVTLYLAPHDIALGQGRLDGLEKCSAVQGL